MASPITTISQSEYIGITFGVSVETVISGCKTCSTDEHAIWGMAEYNYISAQNFLCFRNQFDPGQPGKPLPTGQIITAQILGEMLS